MRRPIFRTYSLVPRGGPGLTCDDKGLALGPIVLAERVRASASGRGYRLLPHQDTARVLRLAYGPLSADVIERRCRGLARVTQLLGNGADAQARIHAVLLGFPEITPDGMAKLAAATSFRKDNPDWQDEPRVPAGEPDGGQWTDAGDAIGAVSVKPAQVTIPWDVP